MIFLALGSNLGDRLHNLIAAREQLRALAAGEINSAPLYETDPLDCPADSPAFLNTVLSFPCELAPEQLLQATQGIEEQLGRAAKNQRAVNSPRPIDIDILLHDDLVRQTPKLTIPHPRLHERLFVLHPLRDLAPGLIPPTHANPISILAELCQTSELPPQLVQSIW